ncbi:OPT family oligopeptide transporter [Chondromyces crocatus]|uniref:Peptide transporter n=1 Tax=Chondromyces crocatus TaxID=52 RepID=A0A0K1EDP4_CHOCO|nr:OPT family oligopeptide transporter [Chondromyces crocatus]AKT38974.1 peptide transporter [Chondromyces crocatus]
MALKQLTPEQVQSMSLEEKDRWWLENVYRGDMPQLTWRSAITGMLLGGFLSLTNLYIGMRTGWSLGVGITSVILAFAVFRVLSRLGIGREMTILENNAMQSIATSAGYVNSPLFSSFAAYSMVTMAIIPMYQAVVWLLCLALLGVLFAFPLKKRFINDEQLPFPEGMAAGVVMDALHESDEKEGLFKAKLLAAGGALSAFIELLRDGKVMRFLFGANSIPGSYDEVLYAGGFAELLKKWGITPTLRGVPLSELTIRWDTSIIFIATGGLMGIRVGVSLLIGGILNYVVLAPLLIQQGIIVPSPGGSYGLRQISLWALWGGVACMTTSSLYSFFSKPKIILDAFRNLWRKGDEKRDVLEHIELPIKVSVIGVPIVSMVLIFLGHAWFGMSYWLGAVAVPLVFVFALIAVNSTGLTAITPTGALGKLTQLTYGLLAPGNITTNVMSAAITAEVASNASNLLMDIKPGYMLGGKPRHQAIGHVLGGLAGLALSLPVWYFVLIRGDIGLYGTEAMPVPAAVTWRAVAEILMKGLSFLHPTAKIAVVVGALLGILIEATKHLSRGRFSLSAVALGLAFLLNFSDIWAMFLGSFGFWLLQQRAAKWMAAAAEKPKPAVPGEAALPLVPGPRPWYVLGAENTETICAGVIAGGALMGIGLAVLGVLVLPDVSEVQRIGEWVGKVLGNR